MLTPRRTARRHPASLHLEEDPLVRSRMRSTNEKHVAMEDSHTKKRRNSHKTKKKKRNAPQDGAF